MRTRWDFIFDARGFTLDRERRFKCVIPSEMAVKFGLAEMEIPALISFKLDRPKPFPGWDQGGTLSVELSGDPEPTKALARWIAQWTCQNIAFHHGQMKVHGGMVTAERIPESPEEAASIGDTPFFVEMSLEEVVPPEAINLSVLKQLTVKEPMATAMRQFNFANSAERPIEKYLGFFKVLELLYGGGTGSIRDALLGSQRYKEIAIHLCGQLSLEELTSKLVKVRHQCAHLKKGGFGFIPGNPDHEKELATLTPVLAEIAHQSVIAAI